MIDTVLARTALPLVAVEPGPIGKQGAGDDELIANMLGVPREGVTEAAGQLQRDGLIHYSRGHIKVLDRARLEQRVCECYAVVRKEYDRLLP